MSVESQRRAFLRDLFRGETVVGVVWLLLTLLVAASTIAVAWQHNAWAVAPGAAVWYPAGRFAAGIRRWTSFAAHARAATGEGLVRLAAEYLGEPRR